MLQFRCIKCDEVHEGVPTFGWNAPLLYLQIPVEERDQRCLLGSDDCIIDEKYFFVRGCVDIPVTGLDDVFTWGVWVSLSQESHAEWERLFDEPQRSHVVFGNMRSGQVDGPGVVISRDPNPFAPGGHTGQTFNDFVLNGACRFQIVETVA